MYPDNALAEFYPAWLIKEAEEKFTTLEEIHNYCTPRIKVMKYSDRGKEWLKKNSYFYD
jgi:hypothetical protein